MEAINRLKEDYLITESFKDGQIIFSVDGIEEIFTISILEHELVVSTKTWHEHLPNSEELESFLRCLFMGVAEVVVTYRGNKPVSHKIQMVDGDNVNVISRTGSLVFPFWRKKYQKKMEYKVTKRLTERID